MRPLTGTHKGLLAVAQPQALERASSEAKEEMKETLIPHSEDQALDVKPITPPSSCSPSPDSKKEESLIPDSKDQVSESKLMTPPLSSSPSSESEKVEKVETETSVSDHGPSPSDLTTNAADVAVDVFPPWDIKTIQDGLGGRYDRITIVKMLEKCRGDIDRAFAALLGEKDEGPSEKVSIPGPNFKPNLQASRESSPYSVGSKRSADDSDESDGQAPTARRTRNKKRMVSNLTLGVGISFRDDQNEVVSLNLHVEPGAEGAGSANKVEKAEATQIEDKASPNQPVAATPKGPRRSGRLSKPRAA